ncbi:hypothetical protein ABNX05_18210 [Lysinibacillus sp. M3]|uniref:Uncharacterized protein n=1 Tax=Lysinibacillus zambalensis TaxID=3160866 RepID=A0ABV1MVM3_9BACI
MLFQNSGNLKAIELPFNWNADYTDGTYLSEYDLQTQKKNDFYKIKRENVVRFGVFGQNMKFFFEIDGSFNLAGKRYEIEYHLENGEVLPLTRNFFKKDLITYKQAFTDLNGIEGVQRSDVASINFGYKTNFVKDELNMFFQPIVVLPVGQAPFIEVKITTSTDLNGHLVFKNRGVEVERFEAPLKAHNSGQINWNIK